MTRRTLAVRWVGAGVAAATLISLLVATQNYFALALRGRPVAWLTLFLGELPVWLSFLALTPVIAWLVRRYPPIGPRALLHLVLHTLAAGVAVLVVITSTTAARTLIPDTLPPDVGFWHIVRLGFTGSAVAFMIVYAAIAAFATAWRYNRDAQDRRVRESQLETQLAQARLDVLRVQIQPHFLFNTLHAISALMGRDVAGARRMMSRLSELLRISLDEPDGHEVALEDELAFLDRYIEIQRLRFGDRLRIHREVDPDALGLAVPRLLLQPLVENAIAHGVAHRPEGGRVEVRARREDGRLVVSVLDDGPGFATDHGPAEGYGGLGLTNTGARVRELYGDSAALITRNRPEGGAEVRLVIPARAPEEA